MAAASGDMRRALEACTAALELRAQEAVAEQADLAVNALLTSKCPAKSQDQMLSALTAAFAFLRLAVAPAVIRFACSFVAMRHS